MTSITHSYSEQLKQVLQKIDELNQQDPVQVLDNETLIGKETLYSKRMLVQLQEFSPDASEALTIACYSQHVQRWAIARSSYPMDRPGYKRWRTDLGKFHAETTAKAMSEVGYSEDDIERVKYLLQKKGLKRDHETQTLEDVICLVFLAFYLDDFASKHSEEKLIDIIQKTWRKMSESGHSAALKLPLAEHLLALVTKALSD